MKCTTAWAGERRAWFERRRVVYLGLVGCAIVVLLGTMLVMESRQEDEWPGAPVVTTSGSAGITIDDPMVWSPDGESTH